MTDHEPFLKPGDTVLSKLIDAADEVLVDAAYRTLFDPKNSQKLVSDPQEVGHDKLVKLNQMVKVAETVEEERKRVMGKPDPSKVPSGRDQPATYDEALKMMSNLSCPGGCGVGDKTNWGGYGNCAHELARQILHRVKGDTCPKCKGLGGAQLECDACGGTGKKCS